MDSALRKLQLHTLLAQTGVGIAASDADGRMTMLSPGLEELFDRPFEPMPESEIGERFQLLDETGSAPLDVREVPLARARAGEVVRDAVVTRRTPAGPLMYLRCNAAPLRTDEDGIVGAIVLVQDVTSEHAAVAQQAELRDRLVEAVNHEFRTPLAALLGHTELLEDRLDELPDWARFSVGSLAAATGRLADLVRTVSELVDLESDARLQRVDTDLGALVEDRAEEWGERFGGRGPVLSVQAAEDAIAVVDAGKVRKAIDALVANAAAYAPEGSEVTVAVHTEDLCVVVDVADHGPGIPAGDRERLVQPFERGGEQGQLSSRGLGLAVARTVATAHAGRLDLLDNEPRGLRARLYFPRSTTGGDLL